MDHRFDLHHIQRGIILSLVTSSPLTFTELQPPRIPNNTFSYHLKKLIENGYIEHAPSQSGYIPTRKALKLVAVNGDQKSRVRSPALITMFYITNDEGEVLLLSRNIDPFQGWYSLPSGSVHFGESLDEAAQRELFEKTGIKATKELYSIGILDFQYREEGTDDLFVHALAFLYSFHYSDKKMAINDKPTRFGQLSWSRLGRQHILPEVLAAKEIAQSSEFIKKSVQFVEPAHMPVLTLSDSQK